MSQPTSAPVQTNAPVQNTTPTLVQSQAPVTNTTNTTNTKAPVTNNTTAPVNQPARPSVGNNSSFLSESRMDENARRGEGINSVSDRLNTYARKAGAPAQRETIEVIKEKIIWKDDPNTNVNSSAGTNVVTQEVVDDSLNKKARNILAESMAKVALLTMENNRLRFLERQHVQDIAKLRGVVHQPAVAVVERECPTCHRAWNGQASNTVSYGNTVHNTVNTTPVTTYGNTTTVNRPTTTTSTIAAPTTTYGNATTVNRPTTTTVNATPTTTYGNTTTVNRPTTTTVNATPTTTYGNATTSSIARPTNAVNTNTTTYGTTGKTTTSIPATRVSGTTGNTTTYGNTTNNTATRVTGNTTSIPATTGNTTTYGNTTSNTTTYGSTSNTTTRPVNQTSGTTTSNVQSLNNLVGKKL